MDVPIVFMFSGQGSQYYQMGRELYAANGLFRRTMDAMDAEVRQRFGYSVLSELYANSNPKSREFTGFTRTNPAILMVELALARTLAEAGVQPDLTLCASMGSFAAATVSGAITAHEALDAVVSQAALVERIGPKGGMVAVLASRTEVACALRGITMEFAAFHFDGHVVVSAPVDTLPAVEHRLRREGFTIYKLPVDHPFHSSWMDPVRPHLEQVWPATSHRPASPPMVSCAHPRETLQELPEDFFWAAARRPIDFQGALLRLEEAGPHVYIDVGPSGTLANFARHLVRQGSDSQILTCLTPFGRDLECFQTVLDGVRAHRGRATG